MCKGPGASSPAQLDCERRGICMNLCVWMAYDTWGNEVEETWSVTE